MTSRISSKNKEKNAKRIYSVKKETKQEKKSSTKDKDWIRQNNNFARASRIFVHFFAVNCTAIRENA